MHAKTPVKRPLAPDSKLPMAGTTPPVGPVRPLAAGRKASPVSAATADGPTRIAANERRDLIATAAYLKAERRGFGGGTPEQDWLEAEAEVDRLLNGGA